ncbi:MAG TPA: Stf0 family sulfotransferase [Pyrinomonadaceae bacterium]|nr:Stf0 family sulfotransferase [Pyrinomonadaceae bacterium]
MIEPRRRYIVAATPRTGSSLLCEALKTTTVAGRPDEVFAPAFRDTWYGHLGIKGPVSFKDYLSVALRYGTTANGVYGLKIQWMHVATLAREATFAGNSEDVLEHLFPGAAFINIVRRDRRGQALSWYRAEITNEWWRWAKDGNGSRSRPEPPFDAEAVHAIEIEIDRHQLAWERYFRKRRIKPLTIEYEDLVQDYCGQVARVLDFLDLEVWRAWLMPPAPLARQSDHLTVRWRQLMDQAHPSNRPKGEITAQYYHY